MEISDLNIRKPSSLFADFAHQRAESAQRANLTKRQKEKQTHGQPEKRENPFRAVVKVLKRKKKSTSFSLFDFKTDRKNELKKQNKLNFYSLICAWFSGLTLRKKKIYI